MCQLLRLAYQAIYFYIPTNYWYEVHPQDCLNLGARYFSTHRLTKPQKMCIIVN